MGITEVGVFCGLLERERQRERERERSFIVTEA